MRFADYVNVLGCALIRGIERYVIREYNIKTVIEGTFGRRDYRNTPSRHRVRIII